LRVRAEVTPSIWSRARDQVTQACFDAALSEKGLSFRDQVQGDDTRVGGGGAAGRCAGEVLGRVAQVAENLERLGRARPHSALRRSPRLCPKRQVGVLVASEKVMGSLDFVHGPAPLSARGQGVGVSDAKQRLGGGIDLAAGAVQPLFRPGRGSVRGCRA
jgi:hypothetical protein